MNNILKNILLLIIAVVLSYFTASYFGGWYDKFAPQHDSLFGAPKGITNFVVGIPFSYVFFVTFVLMLFGLGDRRKWTAWFLVPVLLLFGFLDMRHIYLPILLGLIAWGLAVLVRKIFRRE